MRIHFSTFVTILAALLFVSGTVGCRSNGTGAWYNPKSYTWSNPFNGRDNQAPAYQPDSIANTKPSLDSKPNVAVPTGGYTDESSRRNSPSYSSYTGTDPQRGNPLDQNGGYTMATGGQPSPHGGYTVAESSPYPPIYSNSGAGANSPVSYQYQSETAVAPQYNSSAQYNPNVYSGTEYQTTSATTYQQPNNTAPNQSVPAPAGSNYAPFGMSAQTASPYGGTQPVTPAYGSPLPANNYNEQPVSNPYTYGTPNTGIVPAAPPVPPSSGYNY